MLTASQALTAWSLDGVLHQADDGLINRTWLVRDHTGRPQAVLQLVNAIFGPLTADDIVSVTTWLHGQGLLTPLLIPTTAQGRVLMDGDQHWRLLSYVPGRTLHKMTGPHLAFEAGAMVGRFHAAMADWTGDFVAPRRSIHDTPVRMSELRTALAAADAHPLAAPARAVGQQILTQWASWTGSLDQPSRCSHGDLKLSNLRFAEDSDRAICLLDLDTLGRLPLSVELGDAWRSWCNPASESDPDRVVFDLDIFESSLRGWMSTAPPLSEVERHSLVPGIERICLELAARFATDAVKNAYFREDRGRWPQPGSHNLVRASSQLALAQQARQASPACQAVLHTFPSASS